MSCALRLPTIRVVTKQANIELTATASLNIDPSDGTRNIKNAKDLLSAVTNSQLWISRAGACSIEVSFAIDSRPILERDHLEGVAETIGNSEIWDRLGVHLEYNRSLAALMPGPLFFSIQHPDLSSALVTPASAWTTPFRSLLITINVCRLDERQEPLRKALRARKRQKRARKAEERATSPSGGLLESLESTDQDAIETFISSLNFPSNCDQKKLTQTNSKMKRAACIEVLEDLHSSPLLDILLEQLTLATEKTYKGCQVWGCGSDYCLTKLAPGVFHVPFLKSVSERAQLLPVIAMSLARMQHAESPAIRQKVAALPPSDETIFSSHNESEDPASGIERRAWEVLLAHIQIPPLAKKRRGKRSIPSTMISATSSETPVTNEQPVTATENSLSETRANAKQESQENTVMSVSWNTIAGSSTYAKYEHSEGNPCDFETLDQWLSCDNGTQR
ncbi:hypothetical protein FVEN_g11059 [Fusarium venenatum]|uniref:Uncharacterized protein n=1 Tax=Fusarium venenatum TaxID=56646 RepID=A0A2L2TSZ5_9HYPO|nr:uncharacterized protein FVRRES_00832 [Fusarium venenatum]KAG8350764.1 hypothetical protein FVEN_g11059 [Fusarium venenatum]KAH7005946.1 hypothetical protein EDB82DRAFT_521914 [Fusarium venenatum]CEI64320.1 unnamed protein product [Fusarium venenatum]